MSADDMLTGIERFLSRFVAYPSTAALAAHVLWIAHTWLMDRWDSTPRIAFLSPEPGSGKSRALEVTEALVPNPVHAVNVSPAYLFRRVNDDAGRPTVLYDEIDTVFGAKARDNEDLRGLLNAGHRKGATAGRCEVRGKTVVTVDYPAYCAVALAGLNDLPDTIMTRSVVVRMRRRAPHERVEPWRHRIHFPQARPLAEALARWAASVPEVLDWPQLPAKVTDRDADVWEALIAVADLAGGDWPTRGRVAAVALVADSASKMESLGIRLLSDLRSVFAATAALATEDILTALNAMDEAPWADLHGKPLDARALARRLGRYGVKSATVRIGDRTPKGYRQADLHDAWTRYLPVSPEYSATSATPQHPADRPEPPVALVADVAPPRAKTETADLASAGSPRCTTCGKPNLFAPASIERGTCAACIREAS